MFRPAPGAALLTRAMNGPFDPPPQLIIFDCDGVLADSEMLSASVLIALLAEEGLPITEDGFRSDFLGRSFASAAERAEARFGRPLPQGFEARYRDRLFDRMARELRAMPGAAALLDGLRVPFCLATGSAPQRLAVTLKATGLGPRLGNRCFTASEVAKGKPAPDLFLHAARRMGVSPAQCLVIEDSEMGIRAGLAAGMTVWHFAGGSHVRAGYRLPPGLSPHGAVDSMAELAAALSKMGLFTGALPS